MIFSKRIALVLLISWLLSGCTVPFYAAMESIVVGECPAESINFTPVTGCQNDGSFEFCLSDDSALLAEIEGMSANITCQRGRGRAQCELETEYLCMVSSDSLCVAPSSDVMTLAGWRLACDLAAYPAITELVPTWYE